MARMHLTLPAKNAVQSDAESDFVDLNFRLRAQSAHKILNLVLRSLGEPSVKLRPYKWSRDMPALDHIGEHQTAAPWVTATPRSYTQHNKGGVF